MVTRTDRSAARDSVSEKRAIAESQSQPGENALARVKSALMTRGGSDLSDCATAKATPDPTSRPMTSTAPTMRWSRNTRLSLRRAEQPLRRSRRAPEGAQLVVCLTRGGGRAGVGTVAALRRIITLRAVCSAETNSITSVR